mmetsp:Transcript_102303/g.142459  ORF Transcript_102303/g.142459 Transcript_102303/m.142459 type:complete len:241 (-) Transcript_102303:59-781(-)
MIGFTQLLRCRSSLVEAVGRSHGALHVERAHVLPVLLKERHQEVDGLLDVGHELLMSEVDGSNGDSKAQNLLHLELDGATDVEHLLLQRLVVGDESGELASLVETGSEQTGDLADHGLGGKEGVVLASQLLDELLVLVELLEVFDAHVIDTNTIGLFTVSSVSKNTALEVGARNSGKLESSGETFVTDGIVVLQSNLDFDSLSEVALLSFLVLSVDVDILSAGVGEEVGDSLLKKLGVKF